MEFVKELELWFVTGSQHLYGEEIFETIKKNSQEITDYLNKNGKFLVKIKFKKILTTPKEIDELFLEANLAENCAGVITWMHTFSPSKMWIKGLSHLQKPLMQFHTQFNKEIPWGEIDMDFMNLNQTAHGGREFGYINARLDRQRKAIVGHWTDEEVHEKMDTWIRAAAAWHDSQNMRIARFGDNMREVAVTEGNKVSAQIQFGYSVSGYGLGDLAKVIESITDEEITVLIEEYEKMYDVVPELLEGGEKRGHLIEEARTELALRKFLEAGCFKAFTTTFENLYGLNQLPGLAVQRLMADGYGFGAEGDWKTAALVRSMKVMSCGLKGGTSFMEDYTYHMGEKHDYVLGAHMLEVCPTIAKDKPKLEVHPLGIGGKADPIRLVFDTKKGDGVNATVIDLGSRFRMIVNDLEVVKPLEKLPKLPVARALWNPMPNLKIGAEAWIIAGGAHHSGFSMAINKEHLREFAELADIEFVIIDKDTVINELKKELRWNEVYYRIMR